MANQKLKLYRVKTTIISYVRCEDEDEAKRLALYKDDEPSSQLVSIATAQRVKKDKWMRCLPWGEECDAHGDQVSAYEWAKLQDKEGR